MTATTIETTALIDELRRIYQVIDYAENTRTWSNLSQARRIIVNLIEQAEAVGKPHAAIVPAERMHARIVELV